MWRIQVNFLLRIQLFCFLARIRFFAYGGGVPQEERAQIAAAERRLAQKYADLSPYHVVGVVQHVYARFNRSTVRDYVPLLVERRAREVLARSAAACAAVAEVPTPAVAGGETVAVPHKRREWRSATWAWLTTRFAPDPIGSDRAYRTAAGPAKTRQSTRSGGPYTTAPPVLAVRHGSGVDRCRR